MMIIEPPQAIHMQRHARRLRKTLQTMWYHLATQVTNLLALESEIYDCVGPVGEIDDGAGECFVEGRVAGAEAGEAGVVLCEGGFEGRAEGEAGVFGCVVIVDWRRVLVSGVH